ncbi:MAG: Phosphoenolpyruvate synthase [Parcubacteria group bacterium GW2011_GWA2_43_17]|nr:MAG: Phosphoenolpyruvate synthase [Parcubacteria group bacterium GW2011_GWA2_43_17]KKT91126.1 MAG: Phosphoenolpyruvate synthase [Parcubacteria group bacterium GW2011_GWF2_45_11]KKT97163.1 MAG: Phosphoenolpyruvate synthase [Parcubacteria group bacterium GW2011_GWC2_45_15]HAH03998.1 hypothetical protein [Candidatus Komeilibacteria bacterium]HBR13767.1 hypothetical protein [Candidatus Komeilibacteria bacterium]
MPKPKFTKAYTRDFSIIMEEAWYYALARGLWDILKLKPPKEFPNFYFLNQGLIEVWENQNFIKKIKAAVLQKNSDSGLFNNLFKEYGVLVEKLKDNDLKDALYLKKLFKAISIFAILWYGIENSKTKKALRSKFVAIRDTDIIFDYHDKIVRQRLVNKFPKIKGWETAILKKEFLSSSPQADVLQNRLNHFVLLPGKYSKIIDLNSFAKEMNWDVKTVNKNKNNLIKGQAAYPGIARGRARIIRKKSEINKMKKGEVLIAPMTTPDVFMAAKKAGAIITDEGGQLCHAAIISRELKIPCIIGTKIASQVFKDGDFIEVNANQGIVRKIINPAPLR